MENRLDLIEVQKFKNSDAVIAQFRYMHREGWLLTNEGFVTIDPNGDRILAKPLKTGNGFIGISTWRICNDEEC